MCYNILDHLQWEKTAGFEHEWELKCDSQFAPVGIDSVAAGLLNKFSEAGCVSLAEE